MKSSLFWDVTQRTWVVSRRRFRRSYRSKKYKKNILLGLLDPWRWYPTGCRETGSTLRKHPQEQRAHVHCGGSMKSGIIKQIHRPIPRDSRAVLGVSLRPLVCWDCRFESRLGHAVVSLVTVVYCQVELSASSWSLVQRSSSECRVSECDCEASMMRLWPTGGCCAMGKKNPWRHTVEE
jgi:hypothetical protein